MRSTLFACCLSVLSLGNALAQPTAPASAPANKKLLAVVTSSRADAEVVARANRLTDKMARQLQLNNYQTARLRTLNREKAQRMYALEHQPNADPRKIDNDCQGVCREQERDLRTLLSTAQYADYYESRNDFYAFDKQFIAQSGDNTRRVDRQREMTIPGSSAAPELKDDGSSPVLRQGK